MLKKTVFGGIVVLALIIFGFMSLMRSCLSKYDERAAISHPLIFEQSGKTIIFNLVKFDKTTSYTQNGGFTSKSVDVTYSVQTNDAFTGDPIKEVTVKAGRKIKSYPVEIIGSSANKAWIFANELMAYDPFSMEKMADTKILEDKNPSLAGKLTNERKYYEFDKPNDRIIITATDGGKYQLNTKTLLITAIDETELVGDISKKKAKELADALKKIQKLSDENFTRFRDNNKAYNQRPSASKAYQDSFKAFAGRREQIDHLRDSIYKLQSEVNEEVNHMNDRMNRSRFLDNENNSFSSIRVNTDSFMNRWYGLYTADELEKVLEQFDHRTVYNDAARNKLYTATLSIKDPAKKYPDWIIGEEKQALGNEVYLQGGFLLDKQTALPIHVFDPGGFLIVHKETVGNDASILISRVDITGKKSWTFNTGLKSLAYWIILGNRMIITGTDNKELSSGQNNVLHSIDMRNGSFNTYDFFKSKLRAAKK